MAQRAAAKAAAANVAAKRQEVPGVPRVARYQRPATALESKESILKAIRQRVPVRLDKPRTARNALPKDVPAVPGVPRVARYQRHASTLESKERSVKAAIPSRHQATLDICAPSTKPPQPSALYMSVQARMAQRAAAKAAVANVAATRLEVPGVVRYQRPATPLESKERSLKAIRQRVRVRLDKPRTARNALPKDVPAGRCLTPRPVDLFINAPMAPRAPRFRAVDDSPLAFSLPASPKVALKSILRGGASQRKSGEKKKVAFGDVETKEVEKWIGIEQGTESDDQLFEDGTRCKGKSIHVHHDPCRIMHGNLVGWTRQGSMDDWEYVYLYGQTLFRGSHCYCTNPSCNRRDLYRRRRRQPPTTTPVDTTFI